VCLHGEWSHSRWKLKFTCPLIITIAVPTVMERKEHVYNKWGSIGNGT
jgi:hypothetical protein